MNALLTPDSLLRDDCSIGLELDVNGHIRRLYNRELLTQWIEGDNASASYAGEPVAHLLSHLFGPLFAKQLARDLSAWSESEIASCPWSCIRQGRVQLADAAPRYFRIDTAIKEQESERILLVRIRDDSIRIGLERSAAETRALYETTLAVLRADPDGLRLFLGSAMASLAAIRATFRMPAKTQEALRGKLERLRTETESLSGDADAWQLTPLTRAGASFVERIGALLQQTEISGDDLLPLAPLLDQLAGTIGSTLRIDEQRPVASPATTVNKRVATNRETRPADWAELSRRRWNQYLQRRGEELGVIVKLEFLGAELVPAQLRRYVDEILQRMLENALLHGIETPEHRLAVNKPAAGQITVQFSLTHDQQLKLSVHDNGRGFDTDRIARAAIHCGLLTDEELSARSDTDIVALIFKPKFTTAGLTADGTAGRGMNFLRKTIARLNGQISVATKPARYTQFNVQLPLQIQPERVEAPLQAAAP